MRVLATEATESSDSSHVVSNPSSKQALTKSNKE